MSPPGPQPRVSHPPAQRPLKRLWGPWSSPYRLHEADCPVDSVWAETTKCETAAPYPAQINGKWGSQLSAGYPFSSLHAPTTGRGLHQQAGTPRYSQHREVMALLEDSPAHRPDPVPFQLPAERQSWLPPPWALPLHPQGLPSMIPHLLRAPPLLCPHPLWDAPSPFLPFLCSRSLAGELGTHSQLSFGISAQREALGI